MHNSFLLSTFFFPPNAPESIRSGSSNRRMGTQEAEAGKKQPCLELTSTSLPLPKCLRRRLRRREATTNSELPTSSEFAGGIKTLWAESLCCVYVVACTWK